MFGLGKSKKEAEILAVPDETLDKIHTMPDRFYVAKQHRKSKLSLIVSLLMILVGLVFTALALYLRMQNSQVAPPSPEIPVPAETPLDAPTPINTPPTPSPTPTVTPTPSATPTPDDTALETTDLDRDGLTGEEERLFLTNSNSTDTDSDGYRDPDELLGGFDPRISNQSLRAASEIVAAQDFFEYSVLYPAQWLARSTGQLLILDSKKGDSVSVVYNGFPGGQASDPLEWIRVNDPAADPDSLTQVTLRNFSVVYKTQDSRKYFIFDDDGTAVLTLSYRQATPGAPAFQITFQMIVNALERK